MDTRTEGEEEPGSHSREEHSGAFQNKMAVQAKRRWSGQHRRPPVIIVIIIICGTSLDYLLSPFLVDKKEIDL